MRMGINNVWRSRFILAFLIAGAFGLGYLAATLLGNDWKGDSFSVREYDERYEFIRPLLICQIDEEEETKELSILEYQVSQIIAEAQKDKRLISASVYFRYLNTGHWVGINEQEPYSPASLLKVPIMMAYFKESENDPAILSASYRYVKPPGDEKDPLIDEPILISHRSYTVADLIRGMIIQSDNGAREVLERENPEILDETYVALGIADPYHKTDNSRYQLSAKKYGLFFRLLYNGTYLSREMSNRALELLSESQFELGLRAGTPTNVKIAHKYGVRALPQDDGSTEVELGDCGIVYNPSSPYLLCIMTHGANPYDLSNVIKDIASTVYRTAITNAQ